MQLEILYIILGTFIILEQDTLISIIYILFLIFCTSLKLLTIKLNYITYIIIIIYLSALTILFVFVLMLTNSQTPSIKTNLNKNYNSGVKLPLFTNLAYPSFSFLDQKRIYLFSFFFFFLVFFFLWARGSIDSFYFPLNNIDSSEIIPNINTSNLIINTATIDPNTIDQSITNQLLELKGKKALTEILPAGINNSIEPVLNDTGQLIDNSVLLNNTLKINNDLLEYKNSGISEYLNGIWNWMLEIKTHWNKNKSNISTLIPEWNPLTKNYLYYIGTCLFKKIYYTFILLLLIILLLLTLLIILLIL